MDSMQMPVWMPNSQPTVNLNAEAACKGDEGHQSAVRK